MYGGGTIDKEERLSSVTHCFLILCTQVSVLRVHEAEVIASKYDAIRRADGIFQIPKREGAAEPAATRTIVEKSTIPFVGKLLVGKPIWTITFFGGPIKLKAPHSLVDTIERIWDCVVSAESGLVVSVASRWQEGSTPQPVAEIELEEKGLHADGGEVYIRFPEDSPKVSFWDALESLQTSGIDVITPSRIEAYYVVRKTDYKPAKAVWVIKLFGKYPIKQSLGDSEKPTCTFRCVVDAETARFEWLAVTCGDK